MFSSRNNSAAHAIAVALLFCCLPRIAVRAEAAPFSGPATLTVAPSNVLAAVTAQYAVISNLSCTVRREASDASGKPIESMSQVDWARGDRMRVHSLKGGGRRVVIDGSKIHIKGSGDSVPAIYKVEDQTPTQFANLRSVPGSPEEMLAPLASLAAMDSDTIAPFARTVAFADINSGTVSALLSFDSLGRVARIDFTAESADNGKGEAEAVGMSSAYFKAPKEVLPGVWLFQRVEAETSIGGNKVVAVSRFDRFVVNDEMPDAVFDPNCDF
ncbi:MAG: hypothetical protein IKO55_08310 [Kiritimatiellae bacterium]|nr:hypothetical protein [Kiritimatiellia bacterium]